MNYGDFKNYADVISVLCSTRAGTQKKCYRYLKSMHLITKFTFNTTKSQLL